MKILWSDFATDTLRELYRYFKDVASETIASKMKGNIFKATRQLIKHPNSGQLEETLSELNEGHRYIVQGNFKIVYKKVSEGILITDVFDTRPD